MTITERIVVSVYGVIVAVWVVRHAILTWVRRQIDVLSRQSPTYQQDDPPLVSVIIPARDEEISLPACLDSVRAQNYPNLEILVADDRSGDRTPEIVRAAAEADSRVRLVTIEHLPPGWTGKTHALHVATAQARGEWLWFIDADTQHAPESLSIMMEYARAHEAELVSLLPATRCETFWEKVVQPLEGIVLLRSYPLYVVNRDDSPLAFANGQYILIHRDAYDAAGGHASVRHRFLEDIHLARRVKSLGRRIRCGVTTEISSTRMYDSLSSLVRGWSRILYDGLDRNPWKIAGKILEPLIWSQTGDIALLVALALLAIGSQGPFVWWLLGLSLAHQVLKQAAVYRMYSWSAPQSALYALFYPVAGWVSAWISLKSILMCFTGTVSWRGTVYGPSTTAAPVPSSPAVAETIG
jgi:glycosyltransferase involved in cell wall biosynthesis